MAQREVKCPDCGRRGVPVEYVQPPGRYCPYCGASYAYGPRLPRGLLVIAGPVVLLVGMFGVILATDLTTALVVFVALIAALALWLTMARPGQG